MRYLGIDYGTRKIGLALSDEEGRFAYPHSVIANEEKTVTDIRRLCQKEKIGTIVIGESLNLQGQPNPLMKDLNNFTARLTKVCSLPVEFEREFYTTQEADRLIGRNTETDARAAALILKSYLDKHRP